MPLYVWLWTNVVSSYHQHIRNNDLSNGFCICKAALTASPRSELLYKCVALVLFFCYPPPISLYDLMAVVVCFSSVYSHLLSKNGLLLCFDLMFKYTFFSLYPQTIYLSYIFGCFQWKHMTVFGFHGLPFPYVTQSNFFFYSIPFINAWCLPFKNAYSTAAATCAVSFQTT